MIRVILLLTIILTMSCEKVVHMEIRNHTDENLQLELCFDSISPVSEMMDSTTSWTFYIDPFPESASNNHWDTINYPDSLKNQCAYITIPSNNLLLLPKLGFIEKYTFSSIKIHNSSYYIEVKGDAISTIFKLKNKRQARSTYVLDVK